MKPIKTQDQCNIVERNGQLVIALNVEKMIEENAPVRLADAQLEETGLIEQLFNYGSASFRKVTKKGSFPSEDTVLKALYLRLTELYKKWANRPVPNWAMVRNQLSMDAGMQARIMKYEKY